MIKASSPIIYLDQCHWISLAQAQFSRDKLQVPDELAAADFILKIATADKIRLPLSGAHMVETAKAGNGVRRRQLADTMLSVYKGWHMSNPIDVRGEEMKQAFALAPVPLSQDQVFSQRPWAPFSMIDPYVCEDQTLPPQLHRLSKELSWKFAWTDILRSEPFDPSVWDAAYSGIRTWVQVFQGLASELKDQHVTMEKLRFLVAYQTLADLQQELSVAAVHSGITMDILEQRLQSKNYVEFFQQLPFVGRMMEATILRLRNSQDDWHENDFIDMLFLSCAAAYADIVVAERKTADMLLRTATKVKSSGVICANLLEVFLYSDNLMQYL